MYRFIMNGAILLSSNFDCPCSNLIARTGIIHWNDVSVQLGRLQRVEVRDPFRRLVSSGVPQLPFLGINTTVVWYKKYHTLLLQPLVGSFSAAIGEARAV